MSVIVSDLDGTIIKTDLLFETLVRALKKKPYIIFLIPFWLLGGKYLLKKKIAEGVELDPEKLPYNKEVLWYLRAQKGEGKRVVLATASLQSQAELIAKHLDVFDAVYGSADKVNLKSKNKLALLKEKEGDDLTYLGDSSADFSLWNEGVKAIPVGKPEFCDLVEKKYQVVKKFEYKISRLKAFIKGIRPHQWAKNALIFLPLMLTKSSHNLESVVLASLALVAFSLCASSVYLLNDMFDLDADRVHTKKQHRPLASGALPISIGLLFVPLLLIIAFAIASQVGVNFVFVLAIYYLITSFYSFKLKSLVLIDVILLAVLYTTRIFAGGAAIDVEISPWLLAFSMFFFLSLAFVKRVTELMKLKKANLMKSKAQGRGYIVEDLPLVHQLGIGTGVVSILVFSLYMSSDFVRSQYTHPNGLWLSSLFLFYWITRVWLLTSRDEMNDDPVVFAIKDRQSYFVMGLIAINFIYCM